jgi:hypothetical protein
MLSACNTTMAARLALARRPAPGAPPRDAMLFELPRADGRRASSGDAASPNASAGRDAAAAAGCRGAVVLPADGDAEVAASRLLLHNTLLASALKHKQARFVRDCGAYMQVGPGARRGGAPLWGGGRL